MSKNITDIEKATIVAIQINEPEIVSIFLKNGANKAKIRAVIFKQLIFNAQLEMIKLLIDNSIEREWINFARRLGRKNIISFLSKYSITH